MECGPDRAGSPERLGRALGPKSVGLALPFVLFAAPGPRWSRGRGSRPGSRRAGGTCGVEAWAVGGTRNPADLGSAWAQEPPGGGYPGQAQRPSRQISAPRAPNPRVLGLWRCFITLFPNTRRSNTWTWERKRTSQKRPAEAEDIFTELEADFVNFSSTSCAYLGACSPEPRLLLILRPAWMWTLRKGSQRLGWLHIGDTSPIRRKTSSSYLLLYPQLLAYLNHKRC
nr:uncharacterized protein LOC116151801 [Camelus dromedarius]